MLGKVDETEFKVTGKEILDPGWRAVYAKDAKVADDEEEKKDDEEKTLPAFVKGESGQHQPTLTEKWTTPPPYYNEASLLRAMETAGKFVDDEELRAAMKENGIGRPSSRAGIIETLFKRHYIRRDKKRLVATPTGIELIDMIKEDLLKSCELTGIWEKKLRDIEHQKYDPAQFIDELKVQITNIVTEVLADNSNRRVTILTDDDLKKKTATRKTTKKVKPSTPSTPSTPNTQHPTPNTQQTINTQHPTPNTQHPTPQEGQPCPVCGKGVIIKGKTAYGCSRWKEGCTYRVPFKQ